MQVLIISMFSLYNIVSDILYSVVVCVDFLDIHMTNLVLFFKPGVTLLHNLLYMDYP